MAWSYSTNIRGASGASGVPGASGASGVPGATGATGATGASGGTGGTGGVGASGPGFYRNIATITTPTTIGASGNTDYITLCGISSDGDSSYNSVQLLLHGEGTNGSTTITDSSSFARTLTRFGNTQISTAQKKVGSASILLDGNGDYLSITNSALPPGTGDFTYEGWIYIASPSDSPIFETRDSNASDFGFTLTAFSSTVIRIFTSSALISATVSNYSSTWTHVAVVKSSGTTTLYVNGVSGGTTTSLGNMTNQEFVLGGGRYGSNSIVAYFNGYIDEFRYTKGVARYTGNFTPPTTAFPDSLPVVGTPTLPTATSNNGRYAFRNISGSPITVGASGSQKINGATGGYSLSNGSSVELISDGSSGWYAI